jgi:hypothetical protein
VDELKHLAKARVAGSNPVGHRWWLDTVGAASWANPHLVDIMGISCHGLSRNESLAGPMLRWDRWSLSLSIRAATHPRESAANSYTALW